HDHPYASHLAHAKYREELPAAEHLRRQDFEVYLPLFKDFREQGRRRASAAARAALWPDTGAGARPGAHGDPALTSHEPMFPRYLFLRPTRATQSLSVVRSTVGVSRLVMF